MTLEEQLEILNRPFSPVLEGRPVHLELAPELKEAMAGKLAETMAETSLQIDDKVVTVFVHEDETMVAYVPELEEGEYEARLLGNSLPVQIPDKIGVGSDGLTLMLSAVERIEITIQLVGNDNGEALPYTGAAVLLVEDGEEITPDATVTAGDNGLVNVSVLPGRNYKVIPERETYQTNYPDWKETDQWASFETVETRTVVARSYSVVFNGEGELFDEVITAFDGSTGKGARFDRENRAYLDLPPGQYELSSTDGLFVPDSIELTEGESITEISIQKLPQPQEEPRIENILTISLQLPEFEQRFGQFIIDAPDGIQVFPLSEDGILEFPYTNPGQISVQLKGHPRLDADASLLVREGRNNLELNPQLGKRRTWTFDTAGIRSVHILDQDGLFPALFMKSDFGIQVAETGIARATLQLSGGARLITPPMDTGNSQSYTFQRDIQLDVDTNVLLAYEDGYLLEIPEGLHTIRAGSPDLYYKAADRTGFLRIKAPCFQEDTVFSPQGGEPVRTEVVVRLGGLHFQSAGQIEVNDRSTEEVEGIGPAFARRLRNQLNVNTLLDLAHLNPGAANELVGISAARLSSWIRQANLLLDFGDRIKPNDAEVLVTAGISKATDLRTMDRALFLQRVQTAAEGVKKPQDFDLERIVNLQNLFSG